MIKKLNLRIIASRFESMSILNCILTSLFLTLIFDMVLTTIAMNIIIIVAIKVVKILNVINCSSGFQSLKNRFKFLTTR